MSNLDTLKIKNRVKQKLTKYVIIYLRKYTASAPGRKGLHMSAIDAQIIQTFRTLGTEEKRLFLSAFEAALAKQASPALSHPSPEDENRQDVSNLDTSLIDVPVLPVVDFPGSKDLAVPAPQSEGGVRMDTALGIAALHVPGAAVPALGEAVDGVLERPAQRDRAVRYRFFAEVYPPEASGNILLAIQRGDICYSAF